MLSTGDRTHVSRRRALSVSLATLAAVWRLTDATATVGGPGRLPGSAFCCVEWAAGGCHATGSRHLGAADRAAEAG